MIVLSCIGKREAHRYDVREYVGRLEVVRYPEPQFEIACARLCSRQEALAQIASITRAG